MIRIIRPALVLTMMVASQLVFLNPLAWTQTSRASDPITLKAEFKLYPGKKSGMLMLHAKMPDENYIYSLTQKKIPPPTKLVVVKDKKFKVTGQFKPDRKPTVIEKDDIFNNRIEKHYKTVVFSAPIQLATDADANSLEITVSMSGQVCNEQNCTMIRAKKTVAKFGGIIKKKPNSTKSN